MYKTSLDFQQERNKISSYYMTMLVVYSTLLTGFGKDVFTNDLVGGRLSIIAGIVTGISFVYALITVLWAGKMQTLIAMENAHIEYLKRTDRKLMDYSVHLEQDIKMQRKKMNFNLISRALNDTDDTIPLFLFKCSYMIFFASLLILLLTSILEFFINY